MKNGGYGVVLRFFVYMLLVICLGGVLNGIAVVGEMSDFKEGGIVEWMQFASLGISAAVLLETAGKKLQGAKIFPFLAALLTIIAMFREMDQILGRYVPLIGWKTPVFVLAVGFFWIAWRNRDQFLPELRSLTLSAFFPLMWAGLAVVIFGQMVGHGDFLEPLLGSCYDRNYKRLLEESFEMMGYFFIFIGCLELRFEVRGYTKAPMHGADD
ncbi:MAG: hypothetical protein R6X08_11020 [Desulfosalsimonadaceae bacterium]